MNKSRKLMLALFIAVFCSIDPSVAQEVIVNVRPEMPRYERRAAPSPRHVWIEEEWENRGGCYEFSGGHWAEPPHVGWAWIPGHWKRHPRGWFWVGGHWEGGRREHEHRDRR